MGGPGSGRPPYRGRPTKLSPELEVEIIQYLKIGCYPEMAAAAVGLAKATFYDWLKRGAREKRSRYARFSDSVKRAIAEGAARDLAIIAKASEKQWQASAWKLERRFPEMFGQKMFNTNVELPEREDTPRMDISKLDVNEIELLERLVKKSQGVTPEVRQIIDVSNT